MPLTISKAVVGTDLAEVSALENESTEENTYSDALLKLLLPAMYVAREDGQLVGFVAAWMMTPTNREKEKNNFKNKTKAPRPGAKFDTLLTIVTIKVAQSHEGRGIGKKLVRHVLAQKRAHKWITYEYDATIYPCDRAHVVETCLSPRFYEHNIAHDVHFAYDTAGHQGLRVYFKKK